jgi:hypothetical protein
VVFFSQFSKVGICGEHVDLVILDNNLQKIVQSSLQKVANCPQTKKIVEKA